MDAMEEGDAVRHLPCLHSYHRHCIDDWLTRKFQCPSCMEPVESGLLATFSIANETPLDEMVSHPRHYRNPEQMGAPSNASQ